MKVKGLKVHIWQAKKITVEFLEICCQVKETRRESIVFKMGL